MARLPRAATNGLITVGSIVLVLVVLEVIFRLFIPQHDFHVSTRAWDRECGLRLVPGMKGASISPEFNTRVAINSKGLRDKEYPYAKPDGTVRILCLGDSYTFGDGVNADECFAKVLEAKLNADSGQQGNRQGNQQGGRRWEVINAGVPGTGTANELAFFNVEGWRYRPDYVLLCICGGNDFNDNLRSQLYTWENGALTKHEAPRSTEARVGHVIQRLPGYSLACRSQLGTFLKTRILLAYYSRSGDRRTDPARNSAWRERASSLTQELLLALRASCAAKHCELVVTVVPQALPEIRQRMVESLILFLKVQGFNYVDLFGRFGSAPIDGSDYYYVSDRHWSAKGHHLAADILHDYFASADPTPDPAKERLDISAVGP
ncbi:MAG TPA: GDSL-type esterase/lipase family protein [bacterium]|nr:GDSL-type esterase/lipase family protein [bacterium]